MSAVELKEPYSSTGTYSPNDGEPSAGRTSFAYESSFGNTKHDHHDMMRLGKKQEFKRNFNFISTLGFISIYMATWEYVLVSLSAGFTNGGYGGLFWTFIGTTACYSTIVASIAEMESMAPTSGGQYHWVSEFAPEQYQRFLSYSAGWMSSLGWLASVASSVFVVTTMVEALINVTQPDFGFPNWQYTLIMVAFLFITIFFNTWGAPYLPLIETLSLYGHLAGFVIVLIPLWVLCPKNSASDVFTSVVNSGGWSSSGVACLVSQVTVLYCNLGSDSAVHISEEVADAGLVVPQVIWWSYLLNLFLGIVILITMLFCIGPLDTVLASDAPYLQLFTNTGKTGVAFALTIVLFFLIFSGNITALATTSREIWAFSRDKGFPFYRPISKMNKHRHVPDNAVYLTTLLTLILCLINLGSNLAFNIIVSLSLLALLSTYMISIGCVLRKRILGEPLPPHRWDLGKLGLPVNAFAFVYSAFAIVFCCFPVTVPVTALADANWAPVVWIGVMFLSFGIYLLHGRKKFTAPVIFVEGRKQAGLGLQGTDEL